MPCLAAATAASDRPLARMQFAVRHSGRSPRFYHPYARAAFAPRDAPIERVVERSDAVTRPTGARAFEAAWRGSVLTQHAPVCMATTTYLAMWSAYRSTVRTRDPAQIPQTLEDFVRIHQARLATSALGAPLRAHVMQLLELGMIDGVHALHCLCIASGQQVALCDEAFDQRHDPLQKPPAERQIGQGASRGRRRGGKAGAAKAARGDR